MRTLRVVAALSCSLAAACGGDSGSAPDAGPPPPPDATPDANPPGPFAGQFDSPADFPSDGCVPGSMAGFADYGIYRTLSSTSVRTVVLRPRAGGGIEALSEITLMGRGVVPVHADADHLLVRSTVVEGSVGASADELEAVDLCARGPDGSLRGHAIRCRRTCPAQTEAVTLVPLERRAGEAAGQGLTLVSSFFGDPGAPWSLADETYQVRVRDGIAYVARDDGLHVVDVHDPAHPTQLARIGDYMNDLKVFDANGKRYVAAATSAGVTLFDVSAPAAPVDLGEFQYNTWGSHNVFIAPYAGRTRLYLVDGASQTLDVLDVSDPTHVSLMGSYVDTLDQGGFHDLYVGDDGTAYVNNTFAGLLVLDVRDLAHVQVLGDEMTSHAYSHASWLLRVNGQRVLAHGDEGFEAHMRFVDVEPASPTFMHTLGEYQTRPETSIHNFMAVGTRVYVAYYEDGVRVLDATDPAHAQEVAYYNTFDFAAETSTAWGYEGAFSLDVDPDAGLIYVADSVKGLVVLRE